MYNHRSTKGIVRDRLTHCCVDSPRVRGRGGGVPSSSRT